VQCSSLESRVSCGHSMELGNCEWLVCSASSHWLCERRRSTKRTTYDIVQLQCKQMIPERCLELVKEPWSGLRVMSCASSEPRSKTIAFMTRRRDFTIHSLYAIPHTLTVTVNSRHICCNSSSSDCFNALQSFGAGARLRGLHEYPQRSTSSFHKTQSPSSQLNTFQMEVD
jgi:hypothetical protein